MRPLMETQLRRGERDYYQVAIVALDPDRFRLIDDAWGQLAGSNALEQLARHVERQVRVADTAGDELMLALVRTDASSAEGLAQLRRTLDCISVGPGGDGDGFAPGLARLPRNTGDMPDPATLADYALYWGKAPGTNQWFAYSAETDGPSPRLVQTLQALARGIDAKNRFTGGHSDRVATYAVALAKSLGFEEERIDPIRRAALVHDVGKIGVRDAVLTKETPPNLEDETELARHSETGRAMLAGAGLSDMARWIHHLHERFDGRGYPDRLAGRQIPVESRMLHAADALDKMTRPHAYRRHRPLREALAELAFGAGTRLDPELSQRLIQLVQSGHLRIAGQDAVGRPLRQPSLRRRGATLG
jgi:diguanylate cyclase (GGDEF)-like protein